MSERWTIHHADVLDALREMETNSFDAVLADVPYGLGSRQPTPDELCAYILGTAGLDVGGDFMSTEWSIPSVAVWKEILRVVKPGAPVLSFAGSRTCDLITIGMRAAGFEIRDTIIHWVYAAGYPKSMAMDMAIDRHNGDARPVVGKHPNPGSTKNRTAMGDGWQESPDITSAASAAFAGWGTAVKPAYEPCVVARKATDGTVAENALKWGVGGINIDGTRIAWAGPEDAAAAAAAAVGFARSREAGTTKQSVSIGKESRDGTNTYDPSALVGRWPANVTLGHLSECSHTGSRKVRGSNHAGGGGIFAPGDGVPVSAGKAGPDGYETQEVWSCAPGCVVAEIDRQSGNRPGMSGGGVHRQGAAGGMFGAIDSGGTARNDQGGASRFFFVAKASSFERSFGCEGLPNVCSNAKCRSKGGTPEDSVEEDDADVLGEVCATCGAQMRRPAHPCVKPLTLTKYLATLALCPPRSDGKPRRILVPYAGSGSEMIGALRAGWEEVVGIERDAEYIPILRARIARWLTVPLHMPVEDVRASAEKPNAKQTSLFGGGK